jgi:hypothetical protein
MTDKLAATDTAASTQELLAGIDAGDIQQLPGMGRRNVALDQFVRAGLMQVSRKSWIRSEPRHAEAHNGRYMGAIDSPDNICASCERRLGDMFNYGMREYTMKPQATVASYEVVRFVPRGDLDNAKHGDYFCFDCAIDRDTILAGLVKQKHLQRYRNCIAADGQDVFAFVAQSILEDRLHGRVEYDGVELRLLHEGKYGSPQNPVTWSGTKIGGRLIYHEIHTRPMEEGRLRAIAAAEASLAAQEEVKAQASLASTTDVADVPAVAEEATVAPKPKTRRPAKHAR